MSGEVLVPVSEVDSDSRERGGGADGDLRIQKDIVVESTPQIITLLSKWMYRNESRNELCLPIKLAGMIHVYLRRCLRSIDDFALEKLIGIGAFARVFAVRDKDQAQWFGQSKIYALKSLKKGYILKRKQVKHTMHELRSYQMIAEEESRICPFLVKMHYAFETDTRLCFILDFYLGGDLFFHIQKNKKFAESTAAVMVADVSAAIMHLHDTFDIIHRNLRPEDIVMLNDGHCVLIDLGFSKTIPDGQTTKTFCGTPEYMSPEVVAKKPHGKPVDWWAIGILLYELCVGIPPFYGRTPKDTYQKIQFSPLFFPDSGLSKVTMRMIKELLQRDPDMRLGSKSSQQVKKHPFWYQIPPGEFDDSNDFWQQHSSLKVIPPYQPKINEQNPFSNVDPVFLKKPAVLDPLKFDESVDRTFHDATSDPFEFF